MNVHASAHASCIERLEIVGSSDGLAAIEKQWTQLWRATDAFIFQSHGWISAWWKTLKNQDQVALRIGLAWSGDRLVAIIPLAISRRKGLRFLEWAAAAHSDYGDVLCAQECSNTTLDRLWTRIWDAGGFDVALINRLLPDAAARRIFHPGKANRFRLRANHRQEITSRIVSDWGSGAAWLASRPQKAQNYRRKMKLLKQAGAVQFRLLDADEPAGPALDRLAALKRQWLEKNGRTSELFDEGAPVLKALVDALARAGILRLFVIELDGVVVAVAVNFVQRNTMMMWMSAYDPDFARASPGMLLTCDFVQWSFDHGLDMVDLLCGDEAYKERFRTHTVTLGTVIGPRTAKGSLALFVDGMRQKLLQRRKQKTAPDAKPD